MKNIRINQVGYAPKLPKYVAMLQDEAVVLKNDQGEEIRRYEEIALWFDPASGDKVARIDLGELPAGKYTLEQGDECRSLEVNFCKSWRHTLPESSALP